MSKTQKLLTEALEAVETAHAMVWRCTVGKDPVCLTAELTMLGEINTALRGAIKFIDKETQHDYENE